MSAETAYDKLGPGDRLQVRVWESGAPSVFTAGPDLGELTVDESGRLYLPYVGAIQAAGLTIPQVRANVIRRLSTVVLRPQVDIREVERRSMLVTVQGDAAKTGVYPITRGRTRLSALLAEVAPSQKMPEMLRVTVRRGEEIGQVRLSDVYRDPRLDIALRPGDSIILNEVVENVTVLGAAGIQGQFRIPQRDFSLMDAIGQARGLSDDSADPRAVFLLRPPPTKEATPLVYQLDMRRPDTIALASRFTVHDGDAVLISNAPFTQTRKLLQAFSATLNPVRSATTMVP
jgi:polysaccharide export outer membrane protein